MELQAIDPARVRLEELVECGVRFHGHLGPFLVLGLRMGLLALRELDCRGHFDLEAQVEMGTTPPLSCMIDGIQVATGCTLGKGNIRVAGHGQPRPRATFTNTKDAKWLEVELQPGLVERFREGEPEALAHEAMRMSEEELFRWELRMQMQRR